MTGDTEKMDKIQNQIDELLAGEGRYLSVHEQWELSVSLKALLKVAKALKKERSMLGKGESRYLPYFHKTNFAMDFVEETLQSI